MNILFVCTGNTCRSPMAKAIAKQRFKGCCVDSAGIHASLGEPASDMAREVSEKYNLDLSDHKSQPLTADLLEKQDLILAMSKSHKNAVLSLSADAACYTLGEYANMVKDISDPFGGDFDIYERTFLQIEEYINALPI